jgi:hypothetical protein
MHTLRRTFCVVLLVFGLAAACGNDDGDTKTTTPETIPSTTTTVAARASSTSVPTTVAQRVTDGATCSPVNARGTTAAGIPEVCTAIAGGNDLRWRPA